MPNRTFAAFLLASAVAGCRGKPIEDLPIFHLCRQNVESVNAVEIESAKGRAFDVRLTPAGYDELHSFQERYLGRLVSIKAAGIEILRTKVRTATPYLAIYVTPDAEIRAQVNEVLMNLPEAPCGRRITNE